MIVLGGALGVLAACFRKNHFGIQRDDIAYSAVYAGIGVLVGAKLLYILISLPEIVRNWEAYTASPANFLTLLQSGFVFYGGLIGAVGGIAIYAKSYKLKSFELLEVLTPSIPLIHAFGRFGCFCAGCCYGRPFPPPLGVAFNASPVAPHDVTLFPVQLVESGLNLLLFVLLLLLSRKKRKTGTILGTYILCYAVIRFVLEYFRYDSMRGFLFGLSTSQWISILLLPVGAALAALRFPRKQAE